jgi:hypothetical protein
MKKQDDKTTKKTISDSKTMYHKGRVIWSMEFDFSKEDAIYLETESGRKKYIPER